MGLWVKWVWGILPSSEKPRVPTLPVLPNFINFIYKYPSIYISILQYTYVYTSIQVRILYMFFFFIRSALDRVKEAKLQPDNETL